jgi:hypothetical protein
LRTRARGNRFPTERHDLDEQASAAFRSGWPEFIFRRGHSINGEENRGSYAETHLWMRHL